MIGRGLDFRRVKAFMREFAIIYWKKVVPFIIIVEIV